MAVAALHRKYAYWNASTAMSDKEAQAIALAISHEMQGGAFTTHWGIYTDAIFVPRGKRPPAGYWWVVLLDTSDEAGALGYHELTPEGLPMSRCFILTDLKYNAIPSVTIAHEAFEMGADPYIQLMAQVGNQIVAYEVGDPCEADEFSYKVNGVAISDWVTPEYFHGGAKAHFDWAEHIRYPGEILDGGYLSVYGPNGWSQLHGGDPRPQDVPKVGSRRELRQRGRIAPVVSGLDMEARYEDLWRISEPMVIANGDRPEPNRDNVEYVPISAVEEEAVELVA